MKQSKSHKKIYKIVELYDFPDNYTREDYTVINFFKYLNKNNDSFEITKEELNNISKKYSKQKINKVNTISHIVNIYIECSNWELFCVARGETMDDYIITFFKYV